MRVEGLARGKTSRIGYPEKGLSLCSVMVRTRIADGLGLGFFRHIWLYRVMDSRVWGR